jgi:hypothetical protein
LSDAGPEVCLGYTEGTACEGPEGMCAWGVIDCDLGGVAHCVCGPYPACDCPPTVR